MAFCTECGFKLPDSAAFCPNCGYRISDPGKDGDAAASRAEKTDDSVRNDTYTPPAHEKWYGGYPSVSGENNRSAASGSFGYAYSQKPNTFSPPQEKGNNTKTAIIVMASVIVLLIAAVVLVAQSAGRSRGLTVEASPEAPTQPPASSLPGGGYNSASGSGYVEDGLYYISFIGAEQFIDLDNDTAIRIYYEFTNNDEYAQSAWFSLDWMITQDGRELEYAYSFEDVDVYYFDTRNIRPGLTIQCCLQYKYNPDGGKVDLSMFGWKSGTGGGKVSYAYVPGSLPGAPRPYEFEIFSDPQWTLKLNSEQYLDEGRYYAAVTDAELISDYYGNSAIRVYYEFTNYSRDMVSMYDALYLLAYQDGVELYRTEADIDSKTDENLYLRVGYGETITVSCIFLLRNATSNVEAELEGAHPYDAVGQTYRLEY